MKSSIEMESVERRQNFRRWSRGEWASVRGCMFVLFVLFVLWRRGEDEIGGEGVDRGFFL